MRRRQTPADRWLHQAAELRARWLTSALPYSVPRLEFLRRAALGYLVNHRWQKFVARFYPQIHLAIQPLLRETLWPDQRTDTVRSGYAVATPQQTFVRRSTPEAAGFDAFMSANSQGITYRSSPASAQPDLIDHSTTLAQRLRRSTMRRVETRESRLELAVHRLARQTKRMEEHLSGAPEMVVHKSAPVGVAAEHHAPPESERFERPTRVRDTVNEAPWARSATAPLLSIEQLTDQVIRQIDSRVIAMRERMGRI